MNPRTLTAATALTVAALTACSAAPTDPGPTRKIRCGVVANRGDQPPVHHNTPNSHGVRCNRVKGDKDPDTRLTTTRDW